MSETSTPVTASVPPQPQPRLTIATVITLVALLAQGLMTVELFAPSSAPGKILQVLAMVATALGAPLLARSGAKVLPVAMVVLVAFVSCADIKPTTVRATKAFIDCMAPTLKTHVDELVPAFRDIVENALLPDGKIDEAPLRAATETLKTDAPRCAASVAIGELLRAATKAGAPMSAPLEVDKEQLGKAYEGIRAGWGGATYGVEGGAL